MKVIKVIYNNSSSFIIDIAKNNSANNIVELYNMDIFKERKKGSPIQARFGSRNLPLIVFADENLVEYAAIWAENTPDWGVEINKILKQ